MPKTPQGKRFSQLYIEQKEVRGDSVIARTRLGVFLSNNIETDDGEYIFKYFGEELGVSPKYLGFFLGNYKYNWELFFETIPLSKFLDSITAVVEFLDNRVKRTQDMDIHEFYVSSKKKWIEFVARVFKEERLNYRVDPKGGVHFSHDAEFEKNVQSTLKGLGREKFQAAQAEFEAGIKALNEKKPDTRKAVLSVFDAAESIFKGLFDKKISTLTPKEIRKNFKPVLELVYQEHPRAKNASDQTLESLCKWIDSIQPYRHGQKEKSHSPPTLEFAVLFVSQGASFIRWMVEVKDLDIFD